MERIGNRDYYKYHIMKHGWNAYLRMIDLDYISSFTCPICKDSPEVVVFDGITLGTLKHVPTIRGVARGGGGGGTIKGRLFSIYIYIV